MTTKATRWVLAAAAAALLAAGTARWRPSPTAAKKSASPMSAGPTSPRPRLSPRVSSRRSAMSPRSSAIGAGHLRTAEEQGHRRVPRQLDADHGGRHQALSRRQVGRDVGANLEGAKYTLAVPTYTVDQGLKDFADINKFRDQLGGKIYGIEPGNDGNRLILDMIKDDNSASRASSWSNQRAGHARPGRARRRSARADRLPRLGAAPDEHELQDDLSARRRRRVRPELSAAPRSTPTSAPGFLGRLPERRQAAQI